MQVSRGASVLLILILPVDSGCVAARANRYEVPRNEHGQPDLRGVWNFSSDVPLERPQEFATREFLTHGEFEKRHADREKNLRNAQHIGVGFHDLQWLDYKAHVKDFRTSLVTYPANGRLPKLVRGVERVPGVSILHDIEGTRPVRMFVGGIGKDGPEDRGLFERCLASANIGPPFAPGADNNNVQIFQSRDTVVLLAEQIHDARVIPLGARPPIDGSVRGWFGYSSGRWQGETLVIETRNFNDRTPSFNGAGTAYGKVLIERFTRLSKDTLSYAVTIIDPTTFEDRIELMIPMKLVDHDLYEFACHEGNYSMAATLNGARKQERESARRQ